MNLFPVPVNIVRHAAPSATPAVTAIVTLYNYGRFLDDCLGSLAAQTQENIELVIVDDASTDDSLKMATAWLDLNADAFCGYKLLSHRSNMGLAAARNTAFAHSGADRVFVMDADNMLYPRAIARCMEAMSEAGSAGAYTQLEFFGERSGIGDADYWSRDRFKPKNYIDAMALVARSAWQKVGGYTQFSANGWEDYDFWCKCVERDLHLTFVPEMLCRYRVHGTSMSYTETNPNAPALILSMSLRHPWLEL